MITHHSLIKRRLFILSTLFSVSLNAANDGRPIDSASAAAEALAQREIAGPFIAEALRSNPELAASETRYQAARAFIPASAALPNPTVQLTHFIESIQTRTGPQRQAIMLQQPLPWPGKRERRREAAQAKATSLWHAYSALQLDTASQVAEQVFSYARLSKAVELAQQNVQLLESLEEAVEKRVESGGELADLLQLQVEAEKSRDRVSRLQAQAAAADARLTALLGRMPSSETRVLNWVAPNELTQDPELWKTAAIERSPRLALLKALEESEAARAELAQLTRRPDFTVGVNYIRTGDALMPNTPGSGNDPWAIMLGASLPIWNEANSSLQQQAQFERESISLQREALSLSLAAQAHALIAAHRDAMQRLQRFDTILLPLARQSLELTLSSYRSGKSSISELINSERALLEMQLEYWDSAANAWTLRWQLTALSGGLWLD